MSDKGASETEASEQQHTLSGRFTRKNCSQATPERVYFPHGSVPPINPTWSSQQYLLNPFFFTGSVNPAQASQLARA
ncbi:MAG: hypothetical protein OK455_00380 [Thaumarchaeota archaeon]|nr:hypothetical protein [Nitrososphaerota archaeon]